MTDQMNSATVNQTIDHARTLDPAARAQHIKGYTIGAVFQIHEALLGAAKPRTPRNVLERKILAALAAPVQVAEQPAVEEPATEQDMRSPVQGEEEDVLTAGAPDVEAASATSEEPSASATDAASEAADVATDAPTDEPAPVPTTDATQATAGEPAAKDAIDMALDRARTLEPAALKPFFESFSKTELQQLVARVTGTKTSGRLSPASAIDRLVAALAPKADDVADKAPTIDGAANANADADDATTTNTDAPTTATARSAELPAIGTILIKRDRHSAERCRCEIVAGGVLYAGTTYKSLSAAAIAASKDLGNTTKQTSGPKFWGVIAPAPRTSAAKKALDLDVIQRAFDKHLERAKAAVGSASEDEVAQLRAMLLAQSTALFGLATPAAEHA